MSVKLVRILFESKNVRWSFSPICQLYLHCPCSWGEEQFPHRLQPDISGHTKPSLTSVCVCPEGLLSTLTWLSQSYWCSTTKDPLWCISCVAHTTPVSHQCWPQWVTSDSNTRRPCGNPELHRPIDLRSGYFTPFYNNRFPFFNCQS